jgi:NAD(P)-dependent dehydrogenase (short-subunit alcohol dehydrogenase family)
MRFEDKTVVVTGAGYGLGEAISLAFAHEGAGLVLAGRTGERLDAVARAVRAMDRRAHSVVTDVSQEASARRMIEETVKTFGKLDVLVNNAGIEGPTKLVCDVETTEWEQTLAVNLTGAFLCSKYAVKEMIRQGGGVIVNISSVAGRIGYPMRTPYAASKWGMIGLSHSMAAELGEHNIRVNCICPGPVEGDRMNRVIAHRAEARGIPFERAQRQAVSGVPIGRMVTADEVAQSVLFLASEEASGITGQAFTVCGGMRMQ